MTEDDARDWLSDRFSQPAIAKLNRFVALLLAEAEHQSLIARSTFATIWSRHIVDSAQLVELAPRSHGRWVDIGSGGGLPGLVVAILRDEPITLVEPRRKRAQFLTDCATMLDLSNATIAIAKAQAVDQPAAVISARAVAPIDTILDWTSHIVSRETLMVLPRGTNAETELAIARRAWHGSFHVKQSLTDPASQIVLARQLVRR